MTRMFPPSIPPKTTRGEADMFERIRDAPRSDEYICLHSVGVASHERKAYAEADFVVVGPEGVFCIEAKGGEVKRRNGVWLIGPAGSNYTSIEGPFAQSQGTVAPLRRYIEQKLGLKRSDFVMGWGVAFPHIIFDEESPEWDLKVVYDQRDQNSSFVDYLRRLEDFCRSELTRLGRAQPPKLSPTRIEQIREALRGDFQVTPTVRGLIADSKRDLASLSAAQFKVLDWALNECNPQIICDGAAGTGKTLIAVEAARRLSVQGDKVLLLCFNEQLSRFLSLDAKEGGDTERVSTVHRFMVELIRQAGLGGQLNAASATGAEFFNERVPALFEKAAGVLLEEERLPQFDVIILDEAQDVLNTAVMNCLDLILKGGFRSGRWLLCLDSANQSNVYQRMSAEVLAYLRSLKPAQFLLTENFRNPKNLVREMCMLTGTARPDCMRMLPSNVDYRTFRSAKEEGQKLQALLVDLIREGVRPGEITILSARKRDDALVTRNPPGAGFKICHLEDEQGPCPVDAVSAASVSAFKGLENEVIIFTDVPALEPVSDWGRSMLYVGMTRVRAKLYLIVEEAFLNARERCSVEA